MLAKVIIVMGVAGAGKTTVARLLAESLRWRFLDADDFHPPGNIAKMRRGEPLTDADRRPWLAALRAAVDSSVDRGQLTVLACSALKRSYREHLVAGRRSVRVVYLRAARNLVRSRLVKRRGHFAGVQLLDSQFATLEAPADAITIDASLGTDEIVRATRAALRL